MFASLRHDIQRSTPATSRAASERGERGWLGGAALVCAGALAAGTGCDAPAPPGDLHDLDCAEVVEVATALELRDALAVASSGTCLVLRDGAYPGAVSAGAGVRLVGESRGGVLLQGAVRFQAGEGSVLREISATSIVAETSSAVSLESVSIAGGESAGLLIEPGAAVTAADLSIASPALYGVFVARGGSFAAERATIEGSVGPGLWATCGLDDCCAAGAERPTVALSDTTIAGAHLAGLAFFGADATLDGVEVTGTLPGAEYTDTYGQGGGGLTAAACSDVQATGLTVTESARFGLLFDASTGSLDMLEASWNGGGGLWAQHPPAGTPAEPWIILENAVFANNAAVGVSVSGGDDPLAEKGMIICKTTIGGTALEVIPTEGSLSSDEVGDGLVWKGRANLATLDVSVSGSARQDILINGPVPEPDPLAITIDPAGEAPFVLQQNVPMGGELALPSGVPSETSAGEIHPYPRDLSIVGAAAP